MNTKGKNKNASHLTHEMKKEHGDLQMASMKALITQKVDELNDIRKENENLLKKKRNSWKKDFKLKEKF